MLRKVDLNLINQMGQNTMMSHLGMECVEIGDDYVVCTMPVNEKTHQPLGLLHGGATAALIESVGSMGSSLLVDLNKEAPVGLEINANHIKSMRSGKVKAVGKIIHAGKRTHVWNVDCTDMATGNLVCTGRLTVMIVPHKKN
ncbi:MAG: PaaI family thioesterase [Crocinitomicaceae bacterium]|nr:PaaI family thioesterase [Crocinitomicaceae bacterium]